MSPNETNKSEKIVVTANKDISPKKLPDNSDTAAKESFACFAANPYKKWIYLAQAIDSWRIWPRCFMTVYIILVYKVVTWFMNIPSPNLEQSGLVSVIVGAGAAWFGLYLGSSPRK